jgi:hypothetical protein
MSDPCPIEREHKEYAELTDLDGVTRFCPRCGMRWEGGNGEPVTVTAYPVASACKRLVKWAMAQPREAWDADTVWEDGHPMDGWLGVGKHVIAVDMGCDWTFDGDFLACAEVPFAETEAACADFLAANEADTTGGG